MAIRQKMASKLTQSFTKIDYLSMVSQINAVPLRSDYFDIISNFVLSLRSNFCVNIIFVSVFMTGNLNRYLEIENFCLKCLKYLGSGSSNQPQI